jgi:predicted MFS family arabinose efflux permease
VRSPSDNFVVFMQRTVNSIGWSATIPFLGVYLAVNRGVPFAIIGLVYLVTGTLTLISQLAGGRLTDSIGPKRVMLISYTFSVASSLVLGYLIGINANTIIILVAYPIFNFIRGVSQPAVSAVVANQSVEKVRSGMTFMTIGSNLGFAIGPAIGGVVADAYGYGIVFLLSACSAVVVILMTITWVRGGLLLGALRSGVGRVKYLLRWKEDKTIILMLLLVFCAFLTLGYEVVPFSLYTGSVLNFSDAQIGYIFTVSGLVIVVLQVPISKLYGRMRLAALPLVVGSLLAAASYSLAAVSTTFTEMMLMMIIVTVGEIFLTVPSQLLITAFSGAENRGTFQGYYNAVSNGGRSIASFIGPLTFSIFASEPRLGWVIIAVFSAILALGFLLISPTMQREYEATSHATLVKPVEI